jgi:methylglutaconyl-CoA hydratase
MVDEPTLRCPVCRARQPHQPTCRRCQADLRLLVAALGDLDAREDLCALILSGTGGTFCAGADLNWMRGVKDYSFEQNYEESYNLSRCFYAIYTSAKPTIAMVHGAAIGGANGLLAACDFAFADENTTFSLSEVKIGIVPACISPYVVKRTGEFGSRDLMLTGRRIKGPEAAEYKLINKSFAGDGLEKHVEEKIGLLRTSGPKAMSHCKTLLHDVSNEWDMKTALSETARIIAEIRASEEGQEGMEAFLEKRKPNWVAKKD